MIIKTAELISIILYKNNETFTKTSKSIILYKNNEIFTKTSMSKKSLKTYSKSLLCLNIKYKVLASKNCRFGQLIVHFYPGKQSEACIKS